MTECCLDVGDGISRYIKQLFYLLHSIWQQIVFCAFAANRCAEETFSDSREAVNQQAEHILDYYGNCILRLAYSYLHNTSDAEEVLQDTLIQFLKTAPVFENEKHEKAWLLRVAANISKNKIEYNTLRKTDELNDTLVAEQREDLSFVWDAVKELPEKYREVIHLFYYEGYSAVQIAKILGKNEVTIRSHLHRGRTMLKQVLKEAYDFEEKV